MTEKETELVRRIGISAFCIYSYLKNNSTSRTLDMQCDLNLSEKTVTRSLRFLQQSNIIKRRMLNGRVRKVEITPQSEWFM